MVSVFVRADNPSNQLELPDTKQCKLLELSIKTVCNLQYQIYAEMFWVYHEETGSQQQNERMLHYPAKASRNTWG